jgi:hypothetical protein
MPQRLKWKVDFKSIASFGSQGREVLRKDRAAETGSSLKLEER